jgi:hypothetical protein
MLNEGYMLPVAHPSTFGLDHSPRSIGVGISPSMSDPMRVPRHISNTVVKNPDLASYLIL